MLLKNNIKTTRIILLISAIIIGIIGMSYTISVATNINQTFSLKNNELYINEVISDELVIGKGETIQLDTDSYYKDSIVRVNVTVLTKSNSSINLLIAEEYSVYTSPTQTNETIAPGELFTEDYTIVHNVLSEIVYGCRCTNASSNATIIWSYELLYSAKPSEFIGIEFLFINGSLLSAMILIVLIKQKPNKKNE